jgi:hypothetical protein
VGFMHNFIEGVLDHHQRELWGIGRTRGALTSALENMTELHRYESFSESDTSESADELHQLQEEQETFNHQTASFIHQTQVPSGDTVTPQASPHLPTHSLGDMDVDDLDDSPHAPEYAPIPENFQVSYDFSQDELHLIHSCISNILLPTWVGHPPANLGEEKHGKLKAQQILILFTSIFPLILPEIWYNKEAYEQGLLDNFYHLVAATNIVCSFHTSPSEADRYMTHYKQYRLTLPELFPNFHSLPNHHYAMHNGYMMKHWGPLPAVSEFPGEKMNGFLQQINTNNHMRMSYKPSHSFLPNFRRYGLYYVASNGLTRMFRCIYA